MPAALMRACAGRPGCPNLVASGVCRDCSSRRAKVDAQQRGTAAERGYDTRWVKFRSWFRNRLVAAGIPPVCGASLPGGPDTKAWSHCAGDGVLNDRDLHLDHEPPLRPDERSNWRAIQDAARCGYLCARCHALKTRAQKGWRVTA